MVLVLFSVALLPDESNTYFVESQRRYKSELKAMSSPKGFEEYDGLYRKDNA